MTSDLAEMGIFIVILILLAYPLGNYMAKVFSGKKTWLDPICLPIEKAIYRIARIDENEEMNWKTYLFALLIFNLMAIISIMAFVSLACLPS